MQDLGSYKEWGEMEFQWEFQQQELSDQNFEGGNEPNEFQKQGMDFNAVYNFLNSNNLEV